MQYLKHSRLAGPLIPGNDIFSVIDQIIERLCFNEITLQLTIELSDRISKFQPSQQLSNGSQNIPPQNNTTNLADMLGRSQLSRAPYT